MCPFVLFYCDKLNNFKVKLTFYFEIYGDGNIQTPFLKVWKYFENNFILLFELTAQLVLGKS